jgi:endothelin-converting enzyme
VTLAEIDEAAPVFGFDKLVTALTPTGKTPSRILVNTPDFWPQYSNLVANHSRAAVQGFMMWTAINAVGKYIDDADLQKALGLTESTKTERWETCIVEVDKMVRHIKDHYFISATYPELTLQAADKMTTNIKAQFRKRLEGFKWMSAGSRKRALQKVDNMIQNIGYPKSNPDLRSADSIASYYTGLNLTSSYFSNVLSSLRFKTTKQYEKVTQKPNRNEYDNVADVNAFYDPTANAITIPAGISQLPLFHYHLPDYALYGGLGSVIGHEITHGFDNNGRQWSEDAEFEVWWDNSTITEFEERSQCFVDQYSQFQVDVPGGKANVDGLKTLGENLADAGGMRSAYAAWEEQRKAMPATWNQELPGLEKFTAEQLFFIYSANIWCNTRTPAEMARVLPLDVHSPAMVRILGMAENSDDFRKAFQCKNKEAKCELL